MDRPESYLDLLTPELRAEVDQLIKSNSLFALWPRLDERIQMYAAVQFRYPDLIRFCATSKVSYKMCQDDSFWKLKTRRDFGEAGFSEVFEDNPTHTKTKTWKGEYKYYLEIYQNELITASYNNIERVRQLLDFGVNPNYQRPDGGGTALMDASLEGRIEIVRMLLEAGADTNIIDDEGNTALILALLPGFTDIAKMLLEAGADPNIIQDDSTALDIAYNPFYLSDPEIIDILKAAGAKRFSEI